MKIETAIIINMRNESLEDCSLSNDTSFRNGYLEVIREIFSNQIE